METLTIRMNTLNRAPSSLASLSSIASITFLATTLAAIFPRVVATVVPAVLARVVPAVLATFLATTLAAVVSTTAGCTVVKPIACALVFPIDQFGEKLGRKDEDDEDDYAELPTVATIASAPVLIPLNWVYYTAYGAVGGLFSGFVSDLNMITGHGSLKNGRDTITQPMRTNALKPEQR